MNRLRIDVQQLADDLHGNVDEVRISIDDHDLFDRVLEVEARHTQDRRVARYQGPPSRVALGPSRYLLGQPSGHDGWDALMDSDGSEIAIGGCGCGLPGCWPLCVRIEVRDDSIVWRDLYNWHVRDEGGDWGWSEIGPFVFDRGEYETAIGVQASP